MSRVCGSLLSAPQYSMPVDARHEDVEHDHVGLARGDAARGHGCAVGLVELEIEHLERRREAAPSDLRSSSTNSKRNAASPPLCALFFAARGVNPPNG